MSAVKEKKPAQAAYGGAIPSARSDVRIADLQTTQSAEHRRLTALGELTVSLARSPRDKYADYKRLVDRAVEVFGDDLIASRWLSMPSVDLEGKVPLQVAQAVEYDFGKMEEIFEPIFIRIEHGIYW